MTIKHYFTNLYIYIYSYDFNNEIIIQKYIYRRRYKCMWNFKTIYSIKNILYNYHVLKIDRHIYIYIYIL